MRCFTPSTQSISQVLSIALPVPSKLADSDERGGVSMGADVDKTEGPPGEPARLDKLAKKMIWTWLLYTEARRVEARRVHKCKKEVRREPHPAHAPALPGSRARNIL
jgi:hypothetical protein